MNVSLQGYANWAAVQKNDDAVFRDLKTGQELSPSDFLSRIRADCGAVEDRQLPANVRKAIEDARIVSGKSLTARAIRLVSTAALSWERDVNSLGNRIMDSDLPAEAKDRYLNDLASVRTGEQLGELEKKIFGPSSEEAARPEPRPLGADELFPKLGDKGHYFRQSGGANTCFAMSVLNGCSHSEKLSRHLNEKFADTSRGLQLYYPRQDEPKAGELKAVEIKEKYETASGKLGAFENAVVSYMREADPAYQRELSNRTSLDQSLPMGEAAIFGKALGLVQSRPDAIFTAKDKKLFDQEFASAYGIGNYTDVRDLIASQLRQGGVVTMNMDRVHYVAITGIKGDTVTVVDSQDKLTGTHDLKAFTSEINDANAKTYTFSFLDLPDKMAQHRP